jgi:hypothetical protein
VSIISYTISYYRIPWLSSLPSSQVGTDDKLGQMAAVRQAVAEATKARRRGVGEAGGASLEGTPPLEQATTARPA